MIELNNVTKKYKNFNALKNINLKLDDYGIYCLLGRNGAGKTTLLKSIAGYQNITNGEILIDNKKISTSSMETGVSYIQNFAKHFNLSVESLIKTAYNLQPDFDYEFALEMIERFNLDKSKKFKKLSLGMKTMISTIICLSSTKKVILLDEPVLGFDAIMRSEFYELLLESFERHPRIIIVSTHIIDEISKTVQKLIIIDNGMIKFYDSIDIIDEKAYSVTGLKSEVDKITQSLNVIGETLAGNFSTKYILDERILHSQNVTIQSISLQDFFINIVGKKGGTF